MNSQKVLETIESVRFVAGARGAFPPAVILPMVEVLMEEGINIIELTMNSEQPIEAMQAIKKKYGDEACVGMGTVLDVPTAQRVLDAGADFVVSPVFQPEVVEFVLKNHVFMAPGVATPTEAITAWNMGVPLLKLFPIGALGLTYFKAMFAPLTHMKFMCNGAMNAELAHEFLEAGATACGMAGWLIASSTMSLDTIRNRVRQLVQGKMRVV